MAVAEAKKVDKAEKDAVAPAAGTAPAWVGRSVGLVTGKARELRSFLTEVRAEMKKVTWPSREEVRATTIVVIGATFFFGFYLFGLDLGFSWILSLVLKK
jgi:preprotein translocase subunit SecE